MKHSIRLLAVLALLSACKKEEPAPVYEAVTIGKRDIIVTAQAAGAINPDTIVEVKSRASGEITDLAVETAARAILSNPLLQHVAGETAAGAVAARRMLRLSRVAAEACRILPPG